MRYGYVCLMGLMLVGSAAAPLVLAQSRPGVVEPSPQQRKLPGMTAEREAAVMTFVRNYHPELADLLTPLKTTSPRDYERAVVDLFRTSERLAQVQEKQPERYVLELELWKTQSRVQLLAARLSMSDGAELRGRLREALESQMQIRRELLMLERQRLSQRLEKLDEQIADLEQNREKFVEQQIELFTRQTTPAAAKDPKKGREKPVPTSTKPAPASKPRTGPEKRD